MPEVRRAGALLLLSSCVVGCTSAHPAPSGETPVPTAATTASVAVLASSSIASACDPARSLTEGEHLRSIRVGGHERSYALYVPPRTANGPAPLVLAFHGLGDTGRAFAAWSGLARAANAHGFLAAFPEGSGAIVTCWNAGDCCVPCSGSATDDVAFATAVVDDVAKTSSVDPSRVFVAGFSNGAMLAHRLACAGGSRFAAVAAVSGTLFDDECEHPVDPLPAMLVVHGTADGTVPYAGGAPHLGGVPLPFDWPGFNRTTERWSGLLGCASTSTSRAFRRAECRSFERCTAALEACTIEEGQHRWVRSSRGARSGFDTNEHVLGFFEAHPRAAAPQ